MEEDDVKSTCGGTRLEIKIEISKSFLFKIWRVVFFFNSKSDALYFFQFKIWRVVEILFQNPTCCIFLF